VSFDDFDSYEPDEPEPRPRDVKIDEAKAHLMEKVFHAAPRNTFYERQLQVLSEDVFYHWITSKALHELTDEREIESVKVLLGEKTSIRFYFSKKNRYWKRQADNIRKLVLRFSTPAFGQALGHQGESMFDAAMPHFGFMPDGKKVTEYNRKKWPFSGHDLDRVYVRDGVPYGCEIKNKLDYIDQNELKVKLNMCKFLGLRPLFIMRASPSSYNYEIIQAGGYALVFRFQLYPHGQGDFARAVRETLGLPVDCPAAIADATIQRFLKWHLTKLSPK
jgi:hypothetical protein